MSRSISKSSLLIAIILVLTLFIVIQSFAQYGFPQSSSDISTTSPKPDNNLDKKLNKLRKYVTDVLKDSKVPGLALGIVKDGEVVLALA